MNNGRCMEIYHQTVEQNTIRIRRVQLPIVKEIRIGVFGSPHKYMMSQHEPSLPHKYVRRTPWCGVEPVSGARS